MIYVIYLLSYLYMCYIYLLLINRYMGYIIHIISLHLYIYMSKCKTTGLYSLNVKLSLVFPFHSLLQGLDNLLPYSVK